MDDLEQYNRNGLRDGYNVLKHLKELKDKADKEKGGAEKDSIELAEDE